MTQQIFDARAFSYIDTNHCMIDVARPQWVNKYIHLNWVARHKSLELTHYAPVIQISYIILIKPA